MAVARAKDRLRGKQPKLSPSQETHLIELYRAGGRTISELEGLFPVTRSTIYRVVARAIAPASLVGVGIGSWWYRQTENANFQRDVLWLLAALSCRVVSPVAWTSTR